MDATFKIMTRVKQKAKRNQDFELRDISEEYSPPNANISATTLDISYPLYPHHSNMAVTKVGIYSEVDANRNVNTETKIEKKGTISEDEVAYAVPYALDNAPKIKLMSLQEAIERNKKVGVVTDTPEDSMGPGVSDVEPAQLQSKKVTSATPEGVANEDYEKGTATRLRAYTSIQVRQAPPVPTKSSDLELYLDTQIEFNVGTYSEPINPLDFTRDRMKDDKNDPEYLAPAHTFQCRYI